MLYVDGKRPSELSRISALGADDSFLISRNYNISTETQFSKQVPFGVMVEDIEDNIESNTYISSMGYMQTY